MTGKRQKHPAIAKISAPHLPKVLLRERLFTLFEQDRKPLTWVCGPGGSGKTTLIASYLGSRKIPCLWYHLDEADNDVSAFFYYLGLAGRKIAPRFKSPLPLLTSEYMRGISAFAKRYFEHLYSRLASPCAVVFDNFEHVADHSPLHGVIRDAADVVPDGVTLIIAARTLPPPALALLQTYDKIRFIGWEQLKFDLKETRSLFCSEGNGPRVSAPEHAFRKTKGWAAGVVLLMQYLKKQVVLPHELDSFKPDELFNYFATELFEKGDVPLQDFLLRTSFFPHFSSAGANLLTRREDSAALIDSLRRRHFFIEQLSAPEPVYQYHPLFRDFLQARAKDVFSEKEILDLLVLSARTLENGGMIEEAADLYLSSGNWNDLARLILSLAESMIFQGRSQSVEKWIGSLPADILGSNPWLLYWKGVCTLPFNLSEARDSLEKAFVLFRKQGDASGIFLSWSGAVEAVIEEMGDIRRLEKWIALFQELLAQYGGPPAHISPHVTVRVFTALRWRAGNGIFLEWKEKALALMEAKEDPAVRMLTGFYLFSYHVWWAGDYSRGGYVLEIMRRISRSHKNLPPIAQIMLKNCESMYELLDGSHDRCLGAMSQGLAKAEETGVHIWDFSLLMNGLAASLCSRNIVASGLLVDKMTSILEHARPFDLFYYHHDVSWRYMLLNDIPKALIHETRALEIALKTGFEIAEAQSNFALAHLMRASGERKKAEKYLERCRTAGRLMGSRIVEFMTELTEAALAFDKKEEEEGIVFLRKALALGRSQGYSYFSWWHGALMAPLCVKALEHGIETEYVGDLIVKCGLEPEDPPLHSEQWPWEIKIYTLGKFEVLIHGKPLVFNGKVQKKPLEMLKILIALGGREVQESCVLDALWPDADGDAARLAFKSTLHRLRKLLGREDSIQLREGRISLGHRCCWVDAYAFERLVALADREGLGERKDASVRNTLRLIEKAVDLYRGRFLDSMDDKSWAAELRERLRIKYLRTVRFLANGYEEGYGPGIREAIGHLQRGFELYPTSEELCRELMSCHQKLGNKTDAIGVFLRCRDSLQSVLGIEPSQKTELLYREIMKGD